MKNLTEQLETLANESKQKHPDNIKEVMQNDISSINLDPLQKGDVIPKELIDSFLDEPIKGKLIITFYRGGWCPYCNLQLRSYQKYLNQFNQLGAQLIAISPETEDNSLSLEEKHNLEFKVISDTDNKIAKQFNIVHKLSEELQQVYKGFGIDLQKSQNNDNNELPLPATFIVGEDNKIIYSFIEADYKKRMDPEQIIEILK